MLDHGELSITVTPEFDLDVGHWHTEIVDGHAVRIVAPPARPMVDQLIAFIDTLPDDGHKQAILTGAVGLASLTVHYGSWGYPFNRSPPGPALSTGGRLVGAPGSEGVRPAAVAQEVLRGAGGGR